MKKSVFFALVSMLLLNLAIASHGKALNQNDLPKIEQQLRLLIAKAGVKQLLAEDIASEMKREVSPKRIEFGHTALDIFSDTDVCVTIDFRYEEQNGVLSLLFRWQRPFPRLLDRSYWLVNTEVSDDIHEDTTWTSDGSPYYVTRSIHIHGGVTLNIEQGTVVRFRKFNDPREHINLSVSDGGGTLLSQGTDANPVTFTTSCDFEDFDEIQSMGKESSDWQAIRTKLNGNIIVRHTILEYANWSVETWEREGQIIVSDSKFRKCRGGVYTDGWSSVTVTNNTISDCWEKAIYVDFQGVPDAGGDIVSNTITTRPDTHPSEVMVINGGIPNISGNVITGSFENGIHTSWGAGTISGNEVTGSFYTGIRLDDFHGVVTSNMINSPSDRSWACIAAWGGECTISDNYIEGYFDIGIYLEDVRGSGRVSGNTIIGPVDEILPVAIQITGGEPTVEFNEISADTFDQVIRVEEESTATIMNHCSLTGNYGVYCVNSAPHINFNDIVGNVEFGVYNETPDDHTVYAEENWWGDPSGPSGEGGGTGDAVSSGVVFEPWRDEPVCE